MPNVMPEDEPLLFDEVRALYHVLSAVAGDLHQNLGVTVAMRAVLELLEVEGPSTVPDMARRRRVSRQRVQALVDQLKRRGLVVARDNPAHKRSAMITLSPAGRSLIRDMRRRELDHLKERGIDLDAPRLRAAWRTLAELRRRLER